MLRVPRDGAGPRVAPPAVVQVAGLAREAAVEVLLAELRWTRGLDVDSRTCAARVLSTAVRDARGRVGVLRRSGAADGRARATGPRVVCGLGQKILLAQFFALNSRENCTALSRRERERDYTPPRVTTLACGRLCAF